MRRRPCTPRIVATASSLIAINNLVMDLSRYYPAAFRPSFTVSLHEYYIATYRDRFFIAPPAWFHAYMVLEALYHIPLSLWAIPALLRGTSFLRFSAQHMESYGPRQPSWYSRCMGTRVPASTY